MEWGEVGFTFQPGRSAADMRDLRWPIRARARSTAAVSGNKEKDARMGCPAITKICSAGMKWMVLRAYIV
jgi:hypothetical protein